jgi:hypothetical protein
MAEWEELRRAVRGIESRLEVRPYTVEIRYSCTKDVYRTKSFRCQNSGTRLY